MAGSARFTDGLLLTLLSHEGSQQSLRRYWGALLRQHGVPICSQRPCTLARGMVYANCGCFLLTTEQTA